MLNSTYLALKTPDCSPGECRVETKSTCSKADTQLETEINKKAKNDSQTRYHSN